MLTADGKMAVASFIGPMEPELGAMFHPVIGTLVRLVEPRR
jgi:hypothetical protein